MKESRKRPTLNKNYPKEGKEPEANKPSPTLKGAIGWRASATEKPKPRLDALATDGWAGERPRRHSLNVCIQSKLFKSLAEKEVLIRPLAGVPARKTSASFK